MHVLILDDDPINLKLFSHVLKDVAGVVTTALADPVRALDWCRDNRPDLVLIDYMMPVMDGLEFLRRLRAMFVDQPVLAVMVTADIGQDVRHRAWELGANDFLTKPLQRMELQTRVGNLLGWRRAEQALRQQADLLADQVIEATRTIAAGEQEAILYLSRMAEYRDPETGSHLLRMAQYARVLAAGLGIGAAEQDLICAAAPMHDIGKIGVPDHILLKPGRLDDAEMTLMRTHSNIGADILRGSISPILQAAATIALHHHEKYDGSGYPAGLAGTAIPLYGRIVAVADVFDALTSARPYKAAWSCARAFAFLEECAGTHFDPVCVRAFVEQRDAVLAIHATHREDTPD